MKYYFQLLMLITLTTALCGCWKTFYVVPESYKYDANVRFSIEKIVVLGKNQGYTTANGYRALQVWIDVTNTSNDTQFIDFDTFYLVNTKTNRGYPVYQSMGQVIYTTGRLEPPIPKGATKSRILVFTYPEGEKPEVLRANGMNYHLIYSDKAISKPSETNTQDQDF